jgi:hypothetical protein
MAVNWVRNRLQLGETILGFEIVNCNRETPCAGHHFISVQLGVSPHTKASCTRSLVSSSRWDQLHCSDKHLEAASFFFGHMLAQFLQGFHGSGWAKLRNAQGCHARTHGYPLASIPYSTVKGRPAFRHVILSLLCVVKPQIRF